MVLKASSWQGGGAADTSLGRTEAGRGHFPSPSAPERPPCLPTPQLCPDPLAQLGLRLLRPGLAQHGLGRPTPGPCCVDSNDPAQFCHRDRKPCLEGSQRRGLGAQGRGPAEQAPQLRGVPRGCGRTRRTGRVPRCAQKQSHTGPPGPPGRSPRQGGAGGGGPGPLCSLHPPRPP